MPASHGDREALRDRAALARRRACRRPRAARAARDGEARDRADRGQRLAAESERADGVEVVVGRELGRRVALERQRQLVGRHPEAVVGRRARALAPPSRRSTAIDARPASRAFSTSSFTTEAGRSTTSPAAILLTRCVGQRGGCAAGSLRRPAPSRASGPGARAGLPLRQEVQRLDRREVREVEVRQLRRGSGSGAGAKRPSCSASCASARRWLAASSSASSALARAITAGGQSGQPRDLDAVAPVGRPAAPCAGR